MSAGKDGAPPWAQSSSMGPMMRRRHEKSSPAAVGNGSAGATSVSGVLSRFDVYARVDDDLAVKTQAGAAVTIGFWVLMVILCIGEIQAYRKLQPPTERVVVDSSLGQRLRINVDIVRYPAHTDREQVAGCRRFLTAAAAGVHSPYARHANLLSHRLASVCAQDTSGRQQYPRLSPGFSRSRRIFLAASRAHVPRQG